MTGTQETKTIASVDNAPRRSSRFRWLSLAAAAILLLVSVGCDSDGASAKPDQPEDPAERVSADLEHFLSGNEYFERVRAVIVTQDGEPLAELYYDTDASASRNVFSVTKTVVSLLVGIAISEGKLSADKSLEDLLPAYRQQMSAEVEAVTLEQLLTMTAGFPVSPESAFPTFVRKPNWVRAILTRGLVSEPGATFHYSDAGSHLLSAVLTAAVGESALEYARPRLFEPLGIDTADAMTEPRLAAMSAHYEDAGFAWPTDPQGNQIGFSDLKLTPDQMTKIGQMLLDQGSWEGAQLAPRDWVEAATSERVDLGEGYGYGYQVWTYPVGDHPAFAALGYGAQLIEVVPELRLVVVNSCAAPNADSGVLTFDRLAVSINTLILPRLDE